MMPEMAHPDGTCSGTPFAQYSPRGGFGVLLGDIIKLQLGSDFIYIKHASIVGMSMYGANI
jgi:hypothetical protein